MDSLTIATYILVIATVIVAASAYRVYTKSKSDTKRDVALSILLEIRSGEAAVVKIRDALRNESLDIDISVLQSESWSANKYLFVRDFDKDEWESISEFYNKAALLDEAIKFNKSAFASDAEQVRLNRQRMFAKYAEDLVKTVDKNINLEEASKTYELKIKAFDAVYMKDQGATKFYKPQKPIRDAKLYLENFPQLTVNSVGIKLKKLSKIKS
jgi:hypothetical protein